MRDIVAAVVTGLHGGRFMEETLEALCLQLGASSAWSTLKTKGGGGPLHRSRTASFRGVSPAVLAQHVDGVLERVQKELKTIGGPVPYADEGSFAGRASMPSKKRLSKTRSGPAVASSPAPHGPCRYPAPG
jgi:hypothetical protein